MRNFRPPIVIVPAWIPSDGDLFRFKKRWWIRSGYDQTKHAIKAISAFSSLVETHVPYSCPVAMLKNHLEIEDLMCTIKEV